MLKKDAVGKNNYFHHQQEGTRILQDDDGTRLLCVEADNDGNVAIVDDTDEPITVRMLTVGGDDHYLDFIADRLRKRTPAFLEKTTTQQGQRPVNVEVVRLGDLGELNEEILVDTQSNVYDGYFFLPFLTGSIVEADGLYDRKCSFLVFS